MYNTRCFPRRPTPGRGVRRADPAGRQVQQGAGTGVRRPHSHRRCRPLSDEPPAGARHQDPYELNEDQYKAALDLLRQQRQLVGATGTTPSSRSTTSRTRGGGLRLLAVPGQYPDRRQAAHRHDGAQGGVTGWADTSMVHSEAKNLTCAYKWLEHSLNNKLQGISPPGSAPCRWCRPPARAMPCSGKRGARPTASTTSIGCASGVPRHPVQEPGNLRALLPLGLGLYRHPGWSLRQPE